MWGIADVRCNERMGTMAEPPASNNLQCGESDAAGSRMEQDALPRADCSDAQKGGVRGNLREGR